MTLITAAVRAQLLANAATQAPDPYPVVRLFHPDRSAAWLLTALFPATPELLYGLCDRGDRRPRFAVVRLARLEGLANAYGVGVRIECDPSFTGEYPISVYARAARQAGRITVEPAALARANANGPTRAPARARLAPPRESKTAPPPAPVRERPAPSPFPENTMSHPARPTAQPPSRDPSEPAPVRIALHDKAPVLYCAAHDLRAVLDTGTALNAAVLRRALTGAFNASDTTGAWTWADAYDAAETATVLFLAHWHRAMQQRAPIPAKMLALIEKLFALTPSHTIRSERTVALQQFSTPLPIAHAALTAAAIGPGDIVLEPSAGTGLLAALALPGLNADASRLHLNEIAATRRGLLERLFPGATVTGHDGEAIHQHRAALRPTVIVMNPPFSRRPNLERRWRHAEDRHLKAAAALLAPGGRLVAITSAGLDPQSPRWAHVLEGASDLRALCSVRIEGRLYARHGTRIETRLTVLERGGPAPDANAKRFTTTASDPAALLEAVQTLVPPRLEAKAPGAAARVASVGPRIRPQRRTAKSASSLADRDFGKTAPLGYAITAPVRANAGADATTTEHNVFEAWTARTVHIAGAKPHPTALVESAPMAAVSHRPPSYRPLLPEAVLDEAKLSDAQLESVILAGEAHTQHLGAQYLVSNDWHHLKVHGQHNPDDDEVPASTSFAPDPMRFRKGWKLGDGTGAGKGRQVAGIILDNVLQGRPRHAWLSLSGSLIEDARRDWTALGGEPDDIFPLSRIPQGARIERTSGIAFVTYATLRSAQRGEKAPRVEQLVEWLAGGLDDTARHAFEGVVVFDECFAMANAAAEKTDRGFIQGSKQGVAGLRLQRALANARVVYSAATGASSVHALAYAERLGLWDPADMPFANRTEFVSAMNKGGIAACEVIARDIKTLGAYQARALAFHGVEIDILHHELTPEQIRIYNVYAKAFGIIHENINQALKASGVTDGEYGDLNRDTKRNALAAFESLKQRFFGHVLTAMKCPSLFRSINAALAAGNACVIQLISTGEALMDRRIAQIPASEWDDLTVNLTPIDGVCDYLLHAFPVQLHEIVVTNNAAPRSRPVIDENGDPVLCPEALARRDALIERLAALPAIPTALDQIVHHFGHEAVAEVTGRSRRILRINAEGGPRLALRPRSASDNITEPAAFMNGDKRILVFSQAGGIGRGYHADRGCKNTARRIHYLLEPGWRADIAVQGLGRTHRTNQASAPVFRPVTTNVKAERRFISTIARRLDSLGGLTRGHRDSQTTMGENQAMFRAQDNFESEYALTALRHFYLALHKNRIEDWTLAQFERATGLRLRAKSGGLRRELPPMRQFLNRLLALPIHHQNRLFAALEERIAAVIEDAIEANTYDRGIETLHADSVRVTSRETIYEHPGARTATELCELECEEKIPLLSAADARARFDESHRGSGPPGMLLWNRQSDRPALAMPAPAHMNDDGSLEHRYRLYRPARQESITEHELKRSAWRTIDRDDWLRRWEREMNTVPARRHRRRWLVTGLLLPLWDRLPKESLRVRRIVVDDGTRLLGRLLSSEQAQALRADLGIGDELYLAPEEIREAILERNTAFPLAGGWRLTRRQVMGAARIELQGPIDTKLASVRAMGCTVEIIQYQSRVFVPGIEALTAVLARYPLATKALAA